MRKVIPARKATGTELVSGSRFTARDDPLRAYPRFHLGEVHKRRTVLPAGGEEGLQNGGAFESEDSGSDFDAVIELRVGEDFEAGTDGAGLGVVAAIDEPSDARLNHRPGAHAARLGGDEQRRSPEAIVA